ncbi:LysE family translocator [Prosthecochloris sp. SCSIO W1101]|uniref:LysE family translocator n=1 Tax=Prosthecochloris sp. SCSIO W1101 TaxID=2992242 RepID=UPI00223E31FF|nr:LysE family translocator [Prosthecochloris sp. SCSIO W1101]UZJ41535.1 LysE family translocator [Prosthecochloris sp. SCSIO W1101]
MIPVESLFTFLFASVLLALAPGPDNIFVLTQAALYGRNEGVLVTLGLCTGLVVHTVAVAFGVAAIFQASAIAFTGLKVIGAVYLLYLAWQAFTASASFLGNGKSNKLLGLQLYRRGIIMNVTNPKVSIFFLAFLPQFAIPENGPVTQQMFILGALFILVTLVVFGGIALLAGTLGTYLKRSPRIQIYLNRIAGIVFIGLAMKIFTANKGG